MCGAHWLLPEKREYYIQGSLLIISVVIEIFLEYGLYCFLELKKETFCTNSVQSVGLKSKQCLELKIVVLVLHTKLQSEQSYFVDEPQQETLHCKISVL